jgi:hypothetical protein
MWRWPLILFLACVPSAYVAWHGRGIPQLGLLQDDAIYLASAKSLAGGQGYRIPSLPGTPAQTKYPPGYPLLLSIIWTLDPHFPDNMALASLLAWVMLPLLVTLCWFRFLQMGLESKQAGVLCALIAINVHVVWFAMNLMPELVFLSVLLACTIVADSDRGRWCGAIAGILAGAAYLLKSAALPLLITSPLLFVIKRRYRSAALFWVSMFPFVAAWMWWGRTHHAPPGDSTWTFYTDYIGYQILNVPLRDYPLVAWVNVKTLWSNLGQLTVGPGFGGTLGHIPAYAGAAIALAGAVLLARRKGVTHYHAFALGLIPMLAVWHYPPSPRFALPLLPLLTAGLLTAVLEALQIVAERALSARRLLGLATLAALAIMAPLAAVATYGGPLVEIYRLAARSREQHAAVFPEYRWIESNTPANAGFIACNDAVLYLYTGRPAMSLHIPPKLLYHTDRAGMADEYRGIDAFGTRNHLSYLLSTKADFDQDFIPATGREIVGAMLGDPSRFRLLHRSHDAAVYEVFSRETQAGQ